MQFALLGSHPDGWRMAAALAATGRHRLRAYAGPQTGHEVLTAQGLAIPSLADLEEILADPAVEGVVVAGRVADRPLQLRRALQSERHVLCVHPADQTPDIAYEAAMIQGDTKQVLFPLLPDAVNPGLMQLRHLLPTLGPIQLLTLEQTSTGEFLLDADHTGHKPSLPGWMLLRALSGEVSEVTAFALSEELMTGTLLLLSGRSGNGVLWQATFLPNQRTAGQQVQVRGLHGYAALTLPSAWPGDVRLEVRGDEGTAVQTWNWPAWDPWPALVDEFERHLHASNRQASSTKPPAGVLCWQDEIRCLELDDAVRRSLERRRVSSLEYQEASEEIGFKSTMTLLGCGLLWGLLVLLILAAWEPRLLWLIVPVLLLFLGLQLLRWIIPSSPSTRPPENSPPRNA